MKKSGYRLSAQKERTPLGAHVFMIVFGMLCLIPFITVVSASFSNEIALARDGFGIFPREFDLSAYEYLFKKPKIILDAYWVTILITFAGTLIGLMSMAMAAYALARSRYKFKWFFTWLIYFPTLFSGGLTASYIITTKYLHMTDSLWALILPGTINVFHIFMLRTFFKQIPSALFEAATMDGANEYTMFFKIALPLSKPSLATVGFLTALSKWNEWYNSMLYIRSANKVTLQHMLQRMMDSITVLMDALKISPVMLDPMEIPGENLRMAMLVVAIGPMMLIFPFFQKYFTRGMTIGSVKG